MHRPRARSRRKQALARAAKHAGQLEAYAETVAEASEKPVLGTFIHLPVGGIAVPLGLT